MLVVTWWLGTEEATGEAGSEAGGPDPAGLARAGRGSLRAQGLCVTSGWTGKRQVSGWTGPLSPAAGLPGAPRRLPGSRTDRDCRPPAPPSSQSPPTLRSQCISASSQLPELTAKPPAQSLLYQQAGRLSGEQRTLFVELR